MTQQNLQNASSGSLCDVLVKSKLTSNQKDHYSPNSIESKSIEVQDTKIQVPNLNFPKANTSSK